MPNTSLGTIKSAALSELLSYTCTYLYIKHQFHNFCQGLLFLHGNTCYRWLVDVYIYVYALHALGAGTVDVVMTYVMSSYLSVF
jgi:hypothetical protein